MVGFISKPTIEEEEEEEVEKDYTEAFKPFNHLRDPLDAKFTDIFFVDSLLDFDSIKDFFEDSTENPQSGGLERLNFAERIGMDIKGSCVVNTLFEDSAVNGSKPVFEGSEPNEQRDGRAVEVKEESVKLDKEGELGGCIEEDMRRVSLVGRLNSCVGDEISVKSELVDGEEMGGVSLAHSVSYVVPDESVLKSEVGRDEAEIGGGCLVNASNSAITNEGGENAKVMSDANDSDCENDSESESDGGSSSSSSSGSSSSDEDSNNNDDGDDETSDDEKQEDTKEMEQGRVEMIEETKEVGEIEEGEITEFNDAEEELDDEEEEEDGDNMVSWNDIELDIDVEDGDDAGAVQGPIKSKNELKLLPPVPPVDITLQPYHQMLPIGVVLSILGAQVIVAGSEKHNPLNEGSVLWITENKSPLGIVDEIFGPVKNPYYIVRYNSESEVPAGIHEGTLVSFVPEYANHVLNDKNLYKKGYDASGENDEEVSDEVEFSDDEKEAEYKRMMKMSKRGPDDQRFGNKKNNRKKVRNRNGNWKNVNPPGQQNLMGQPPTDQNQLPVQASMSLVNCSSSPATAQDFPCGSGFISPHLSIAQNAGVFPPVSGVWHNGVPAQQPQSTVIPMGFSANNMLWPAQNQFQHPYQMPMPSGIPFQQFNPSQGSLPNAVLPGGPPILFAGPPFPSWPGVVGQNSFNQTTFGLGYQGQPAGPMNAMNLGDQGVMSEQNLQQPAVIPGNNRASQQFNMGVSASHGKKEHRREVGRFAGRRGWQPSK